MTYLLDANVLIAWMIAEHPDNAKVSAWVGETLDEFLICPITQGALMRYVLRTGRNLSKAEEITSAVFEFSQCRWIPDDLPFQNTHWNKVTGHRQVTDVYLAELARQHEGLLATLDKGIAGLRPDATYLIS